MQVVEDFSSDDEFAFGVWWRPDESAPGTLRPATGRECAAEIWRLRGALAEAEQRVRGLRRVLGVIQNLSRGNSHD